MILNRIHSCHGTSFMNHPGHMPRSYSQFYSRPMLLVLLTLDRLHQLSIPNCQLNITFGFMEVFVSYLDLYEGTENKLVLGYCLVAAPFCVNPRSDVAAVCVPECQNGGSCLAFNMCNCPQQFRGPHCQYCKYRCKISWFSQFQAFFIAWSFNYLITFKN